MLYSRRVRTSRLHVFSVSAVKFDDDDDVDESDDVNEDDDDDTPAAPSRNKLSTTNDGSRDR